MIQAEDAGTHGVYRCVTCGCLWRLNPPPEPGTLGEMAERLLSRGSWSLFDAKQAPGKCCDNAPMVLEPVL